MRILRRNSSIFLRQKQNQIVATLKCPRHRIQPSAPIFIWNWNKVINNSVLMMGIKTCNSFPFWAIVFKNNNKNKTIWVIQIIWIKMGNQNPEHKKRNKYVLVNHSFCTPLTLKLTAIILVAMACKHFEHWTAAYLFNCFENEF